MPTSSAALPPRSGASLGHYELLEKLGTGATGSVYLARDARLGRLIALKVLSAELAGRDECLARFEREARALAALNHPNIVTIHSVEEGDGKPFFTMEYVPGTRLDELIPDKGLALEPFLRIASPLAEALEAAHERGIVHRDLKPANVLVTARGHVKVLDFGLSKLYGEGRVLPLARPASAPVSGPVDTVTQDGALVGTLPYMSPEQVRGEPVDHRSDLFSLGVVLYEMAVGRRPFPEDDVGHLLAAILRTEPPAVHDVRPELPSRLSQLILRCLEKEPDRRWPSAGAVRRELESLGPAEGARAGPSRSIAVLPFADLDPRREEDSFCAGLAEEIIHALNRLEGLRVASRSSSFLFRAKSVDAREAGRRLGVDAVLEGSVRRSGDRLRIIAELVDVERGFGLWSERYDCPAQEVFEVQERIARSIVEALEIALSPQEWRAMRAFGTPVPGAYEAYLKGRKFYNDYDRRGIEVALELFKRTVELDSGFAPAYAGIADCCSYLHAHADPDGESLECALDASRRALDLGPMIPDAHVAHGVALSLAHRDDEAEQSFREAVRLDPQSFDGHYYWARHCFSRGRKEEAIRLYARAADLRPEDYQAPLLMAQSLDDLGHPKDAREARQRGVARAEERLKLSPEDTRALYMGANGLVALGETERGLRWARRAQRRDPDEPMLLYNLACIFALAGVPEEALACLEHAEQNGFAHLDWLEHDSNLDVVRGHARFQAVLERIAGR